MVWSQKMAGINRPILIGKLNVLISDLVKLRLIFSNESFIIFKRNYCLGNSPQFPISWQTESSNGMFYQFQMGKSQDTRFHSPTIYIPYSLERFFSYLSLVLVKKFLTKWLLFFMFRVTNHYISNIRNKIKMALFVATLCWAI
jgi:hypothetical protein